MWLLSEAAFRASRASTSAGGGARGVEASGVGLFVFLSFLIFVPSSVLVPSSKARSP